jgi:GNAT superfamily N-acetyltransferase
MEEDKNFILNSWLKSYRNAPAVKKMENSAYYHEQGKIIKALLENANVLIACDENDHNNIYGYLVSQRQQGVFIIYYLYTKLPFRNFGIGKKLIQARAHQLGVHAGVYTHHTEAASSLAYKYRFMYNPFRTQYFADYIGETEQNDVAQA